MKSASTTSFSDNRKVQKRIKTLMTLAILIVILYVSGREIGANFGTLAVGFPQMGVLLSEMFPPDFSYFSQIADPLKETIRMAILGTTIGGIFAIPLSFLAASNVTRTPFLYYPARFILNLIRTIPDLLFAAIFVAIFGIGPISGIFAIACFSFGYIAKLTYESIETISQGPLEAMTAVGSNKIQWIHFGVVPQVLPQFISYFLYTLEINVRAAAVLGLVGAGGIGLYLNRTLGLFKYQQTSVIIIATLVAVVIIDGLSTIVREKLL